jgi:hypothetical protein
MMAVSYAFEWPPSLSVLVVTPTSNGDDTVSGLSELAAGLGATGHRVRRVCAPGPMAHEPCPQGIPFRPVRGATGRLHLAGELAACSRIIYQALCTETTHIIHCASLRMARASSLATFPYMLRHPCAPEPAIVTTIGDADYLDAVCTQSLGRRVRLPSDCVIVSTAHARDALLSRTHDQRLGERVHVIAAGDGLVATTLVVYRVAWDRRQRENERALLPIEI